MNGKNKKLKQPFLFYNTVRKSSSITEKCFSENVFKATQTENTDWRFKSCSPDPLQTKNWSWNQVYVHILSFSYRLKMKLKECTNYSFNYKPNFIQIMNHFDFCRLFKTSFTTFSRWESASTWSTLKQQKGTKTFNGLHYLPGARRVSATVWSGVCGCRFKWISAVIKDRWKKRSKTERWREMGSRKQRETKIRAEKHCFCQISFFPFTQLIPSFHKQPPRNVGGTVTE